MGEDAIRVSAYTELPLDIDPLLKNSHTRVKPDTRPLSDLERMFIEVMAEYAVYDNETSQLQEPNDYICISDIETFEILDTSVIEGSEAAHLLHASCGKKCYEILQERSEPCVHCAEKSLYEERYHVWQNRIEAIGREYLHKTRQIIWGDRLARMDIALDITDNNRKAALLAETMDGMNLWSSCAERLTGEPDFNQALNTILKNIGEFFGADNGVLALFGETRYSATWAKEGEYPVPPMFADPTKAALDQWSVLLKGRTYARINDTSHEKIPQKMREYFAKQGIHSTQLSPIFLENRLMGVLCMSNAEHHKTQLYVIDMIAQSIAHVYQQVELKKNLNDLRYRDPLTGHLNFEGFRRVADRLIRENPDKKYSLWYSDIRRFKYINDMFGYETGDGFLQYWADFIVQNSREGEAFCRFSGDNVNVLRTYEDKDDLLGRFDHVSDSVAHYPGLKDKNFKPELVSGVYLLTDEDKRNPDITKMLNYANIAQKSIKNLEGSRIAFYDDSMRATQLRELEISQHLEEGMKNQEFFIVLQPQYKFTTNELVGAEALVRWVHPELGPIYPGEFIPLLEKAGLVSKLDCFVWEEACKQVRYMIDHHDESNIVPISVNISRMDIYLPDLGGLMSGLVEKYDFAPELLKLEITESAYIADSEQLIEVVEDLRRRGFSVEMDDFGSGYSSLNILKDVPVDVLKLDMRFLAVDNNNSKRGGSILSSIIRMAHWMGLSVVAEGVETLDQADYLKDLGCYNMQGYYFARPMSVDDFNVLLKEAFVGDLSLQNSSGALKDTIEFLSVEGESSYLFNNCIGGACLVEFDGNTVEGLLVNDRFYSQMGISRDEGDLYRTNLAELFCEDDRLLLVESLHQAIEHDTSQVFLRSKIAAGSLPRWVRGSNRYLASRNGTHMLFCMIEDVTSQRLSEMRLEELGLEAASFRSLIDGALVRYSATEEGAGFNYASDNLYPMLGYTQGAFEKYFGGSFSAMVYDEDRDRVAEQLATRAALDDVFQIEYRVATASGELAWIRDKRRIITDFDGNRWWFAILTKEPGKVLDSKAKRWQEVQYYVVAQLQKAILYDYDVVLDSIVFCSNGNRGEAVETSFDHYLRDQPFQRIHPDFHAAYVAEFEHALKEATSGSIEFRAKYFKPEYSWCRSSYVSLADETGKVYRLVGRVDDIENEHQLHKKVNRDPLTGLLNQAVTKEVVSGLIAEHSQGALFVIDIDDFKSINDSLGHLFGDSFLREVSDAMAKVFREHDVLGRIGGDEFVAFIPEKLDRAVIEKRAQAILDAFCGIQIPQIGAVHASIGIAVAEEDLMPEYARLFNKADRALYKAKQAGKNRFVLYHAQGVEDELPLSLASRNTKEGGSSEGAVWSSTIAGDVFTILYQSDRTRDGINEAIAHVGRWLDVSRVYVFEKRDGLLYNTFEWCNDGIDAEIDNLQAIPDGDENGAELYIENFDMDNIFYLRHAEDAPEWQRELLEPQNIKSLLQYGVIERDELWGFVGFDECNENVFWTKQQIDVLVRIAQMITVFLKQLREREAG